MAHFVRATDNHWINLDHVAVVHPTPRVDGAIRHYVCLGLDGTDLGRVAAEDLLVVVGAAVANGGTGLVDEEVP